MMLAAFALLSTVLQGHFAQMPSTSYCYSNDSVRPQELHYGTKVDYSHVKGSEYKTAAEIPSCRAVKFWIFVRHGARLPEKETIEGIRTLKKLQKEILKKHANGTTQLCDADAELIRSWKFDRQITPDDCFHLSQQGYLDSKQLGIEYAEAYSHLLPKKYDSDHYLFRHTGSQRATNTYIGFIEGLFGNKTAKRVIPFPVPNPDILLNPYEYCPAYKEHLSTLKDPKTLYQSFKHTPMIDTVVDRVSKRFGYQSPLPYETIAMMFDLCRYEQSWYVNKSSPWCAAFTLDDIIVLEYYEDLKREYLQGHINDNPKMPCALIQDMLKRLESSEAPYAILYFGHSTYLHLLLSSLGPFNDNKLLTDKNYYFMTHRRWRTSHIAPFLGNLAVIKYNCSGSDSQPSIKLKFLLNQKSLTFDWCTSGICDLNDVLVQYNYYYKANCTREYCKSNRSSHLHGSIYILFLGAIISILKIDIRQYSFAE